MTTLSNFFSFLATAVLTFLQTLPAAAAPPSPPNPAVARVYGVERAGSEIKFQVKSRLKTIEGVFENWKAQIDFDPAHLDGLQLGLQAESASIKTGNSFEETLIRGETFFAAEKHPEVSVASKKIDAVSAGGFRMEADLTLRGTTHSVAIPFTLEFNGEQEGLMRGEFDFSRRDFGITYNMVLNPIEDTVKVIVTLKIRGQKPEVSSPSSTKN